MNFLSEVMNAVTTGPLGNSRQPVVTCYIWKISLGQFAKFEITKPLLLNQSLKERGKEMIMIVITIMTEPNKLRNAPSVFVVTNITTMTDLLLVRTFFLKISFSRSMIFQKNLLP